ncbi:MAG TPA: ROK family protein, partial [Anaerolineae bacterium]|nr:ROK family protein [Anaerolineae bacterium]
RSAVLGLLREHGPLSRSDIAKLLNLSPPTVTRIVSQLIAEGLLREGETTESATKIGRPRTLLHFNFLAHMVIGVDVGGAKTTGSVADLHGDIFYRKTVPSIPDGDRSRSLPAFLDFLEDLLEAAPAPREKIRGIGVGVPSFVLEHDGTVVWAPALGWRDVPLKRLVEDRFGIPSFIENDVNLAALGESQFGIGRGIRNLVCIFIGTGIGGGLILNGELYRGHGGAAGEVGYMVPSPDLLEHSYDDEFGCLESLAAGPGVVRRAEEAISKGAQTSLEIGDALTAKQVFQAARDGDALAQKVVTETVDYLAQAVANVACTLNPEMIILGGALTRSGDLLLEPIKERVRRVVPFWPKIVLTQLGDDAVLQGAIALAIRATQEDISVQEGMA